jgi:HPt (histidine-containing phosphotransfer) domain-containing protein
LENQIITSEMNYPTATLPCLQTRSQIGVEEIDLSGLTSLADLRSINEPDLVVELIDLYLKDASERIQAIKAAAARADATVLKQAAHALKGSSAGLGFQQIAEISEQLEQLDWRDSRSRLDALTELLQYRFARLRETLLTLRRVRLSQPSIVRS